MMASLKEMEVKKSIVTFWHDHKEAIVVGTFCVVGTALAMKTRPMIVSMIEGDGNIAITAETITNVTHNHAPKRLSYIVTDGNRWWETQAAAALELGESTANVSKHLNHGRHLDCGASLERVGVRS